MFYNYLKIALRSLIKQPFYTFLNITAVTLSISICLVILFVSYNQFNYDSQNPEVTNIYRINSVITNRSGEKGTYATSPYLEKSVLDSSSFSSFVSLVPLFSKQITFGNERYTANGAIVTGNYTGLFGFIQLNGKFDSESENLNQIAISKQLSERIFNSTQTIEEIISIDQIGDFRISAIYDESLIKSHITNDFLLPSKNINSLIDQRKLDSNFKNPTNYTASYLYVVRRKDVSQKDVEGSVLQLTRKLVSGFKTQSDLKNIRLVPQSLSDISPTKDIWMENSRALSYSTVAVFATIITLIVCLTAFNYSSVMIALGLSRSKEIGIRKIVGAARTHVFWQFITESVTLALISFVCSLAIFPFLITLGPFQTLLRNAQFSVNLLGIFLGFALLVGLIAGVIPALILSSFKPLNLLYNLFTKVAMRGLSFRKVLIVLQFAISFAMILFVVVLLGQTRFMANSDYGYSYKNVTSIPIRNHREFAIIKDEIGKLPGVEGLSGISTNLGYMPTDEIDIWNSNPLEKVRMATYYIDENTIPELQLEIAAGNNFTSDSASNSNCVVINEAAASKLQFKNVNDALSQSISIDDSTQLRIIGVLKDFHFQNFKRTIQPLMLRFDPARLAYLNVRVHPSNQTQIEASLSSSQIQSSIGRPLEYLRWEDTYKELQAHSGDINVVLFFTVAFLIMGCIGLIGIVTYSTNQRVRETTLRKVLGANPRQIFALLTREYFFLISLAIILGLPVGIWAGQEFLNEFPYRITIDFGLIVKPILLLVALGIAMLTSLTVKNSLSNPIKNLRS